MTGCADTRRRYGFTQARSAERVGRNALCPCGSGIKYKRCCLQREPTQQSKQVGTGLAGWPLDSRKKLHQFEKYVCNVYGLPQLLASLTDGRRGAVVPTFDVVNSLIHTAVLRIPSINALEGDLKEADFQKLIGRTPKQDVKAFSADVVANVLDTLELGQIANIGADVIGQAERNKAFREGSYGALRCVAIDGWEPFSSYHRHCPDCLVRRVEVKRSSCEVEGVDQYYHHYVVALLVGPLIDVVVGIEPVRNKQARIGAGEKNVDGDEGELTAAHRLLDKLHETYGTFIDAFIFDGLYPNGPLLSKLTELNYSALIVLRKHNNEPLKEALALWQGQAPCKVVDDQKTGEHIEFWDVDELETLDTFKGKIRVIRAEVNRRHDLHSLFNHRQRRADRHVRLSVLQLFERSANDSLPSINAESEQTEQCRARWIERKRHEQLTNVVTGNTSVYLRYLRRLNLSLILPHEVRTLQTNGRRNVVHVSGV